MGKLSNRELTGGIEQRCFRPRTTEGSRSGIQEKLDGPMALRSIRPQALGRAATWENFHDGTGSGK